jgi:hypothetical protein
MGKYETWTDLRIEVQNICDSLALKIKPLDIHEWSAIEYRIISHFTGDKQLGFTWMWENRISDRFDHYSKNTSGFEAIREVLPAAMDHDESVWFFIEDSFRLKTKFWGYSGDIHSLLLLLGELPGCDYYIVSKKLRWVVGENHSDVLFAYGEIAEKFRTHRNPE